MGHDTGFKCKFKFSFLIFSNICCWYTLELPLIEAIPMLGEELYKLHASVLILILLFQFVFTMYKLI